MTTGPIPSEQYAFLADRVYLDNIAGSFVTGPGGRRFLVVESFPDPESGYYGTIYQDEATGAYIVAHRGTQPGTDFLHDVIEADGQMAVLEVNQQLGFAKYLTERAIDLAAGGNVSITGHSLGGSLAQITSSLYGLYAETFNAYGVGDLGYEESGAGIVNHVRASDMISSAGLHIGEVRVYAASIDDELILPDYRTPIELRDDFISAFNPDVTHAMEHFFQGEHAHEFILNQEGQLRYSENKIWYDLHRATVRQLALSLEFHAGALTVLEYASGLSDFGLLNNIKDILEESYENAQRRVFLGTDIANVRIGTDGADVLKGNGGEDTFSGGQGNDLLDGGEHADILRGEDGRDLIRGGEGDDFIEGGKHNDTLEGGAGYDTYNFTASDFSSGSEDTVFDSDDWGVLTYEQVPIGNYTFNRLSSDGLSWRTQDGVFSLQVVGTSLVIVHQQTGGRILVKNWTDGAFGITKPAPDAPGGSTALSLSGDKDLFGDDGHPSPTNPVSGDDSVSGLGGNDGIDGGYGDDWIDGGQGEDLILGGPGSNQLIGGSGDDILISGSFVMGWSQWDETVFGPLLEARADVGSYGNGWYAYTADGSAYTGDAYQRLSRLGLSAWGVEGSDPNGGLWFYPNPDLHPSGADNIDAGEGADTAYGGDGADTIHGGTGNDVLIGGRDADSISGGDDDDLILGDELTSGTNIFVGLSQHVSTNSNASGNDVLTGGAGNDRIYGQGGNDVIDGGVGNDVLSGDRLDYGLPYVISQSVVSGNDHIDGGAGNDEIYGDGGNDTLLGGSGTDTIMGDTIAIDGSLHGNDTISGGADADTVFGMGGNDIISGDDGDDILIGDANVLDVALQFHGNDVLSGGAGNDELQGGGGNDLLDGGEDNDILFGESGRDQLLGGAGDDELAGGEGDDSLEGGSGADFLFGEAGADILSGGADNDQLQGGDGDDYLRGGTEHDKLYGQAGADRLFGDEGWDELQGGDGNDKLDGGDGNDKLWGDAGDDQLSGGNDNDQLVGGIGNDTLNGGAGNDILNGNTGADTLFGGDGNDNISGNEDADRLEGGAGVDDLYGDAGADLLFGGEGDDYLEGGGDNDTLDGGAGNDLMYGNFGDDTLIAGAGNDRMAGSFGHDTYVFETGFGSDRIYVSTSTDATLDTVIFGSSIDPGDITFALYGDDLIVRVNGTQDVLTIEEFFAPNGNNCELKFSDDSVLTRSDFMTMFGLGIPVSGTNGDDVLAGTESNDSLFGQYGKDTLIGAGGNDYLNGGHEDDILNGGSGNDVLEGGYGRDIYLFETGFGVDKAILSATGSSDSDTVKFGATLSRHEVQLTIEGSNLTVAFLHGPNDFDVVILENFFASGMQHKIEFADGVIWTASDYGYEPGWVGTSGDDNHTGSQYNDKLDGFDGNDILHGGDGNDLIRGGAGDDTLYGDAGDDKLFGDAGNDTAYGGDGDDIYENVENVVEAADGGIDTVKINDLTTSSTYVLPDNVENLEALFPWRSVYSVDYIGNALDNNITVRSSANYTVIDGGAGADHMTYAGPGTMGIVSPVIFKVDNVGDTIAITGHAPYEVMVVSTLGGTYQFQSFLDDYSTGTTELTHITGNALDNMIDVRFASIESTVAGGLGNDYYIIRDDQTVIEAAGAGIDTIEYRGSGNGDLRGIANVENLAMDVSGIGYGNELSNRLSFIIVGGYSAFGTLYGEGGDDTLNGAYGADSLYGGAGNDYLYGGTSTGGWNHSNDLLDGGTGDDFMAGGDGVDTYYVDSANDIVIDDAGWGDKIYASVDYTLSPSSGVESLELTGEAISATGNDLQNAIIGNELDNILRGGKGDSDQLYGRQGADTYRYEFGDGNDYIYETENSSSEVDVLELGAGISTSDVRVLHTTSGIVIKIGSDGSIGILDGDDSGPHDYDDPSRLEHIRFADGTVWNVDEVANRQPVALEVPPQDAFVGEAFSMVLPANLFVNDPGEPLTITMTLPDWLSYDEATRTLSGTPPAEIYPYQSVVIDAVDPLGQTAQLQFTVLVFNRIDGTAAADTLMGTDYSDVVRGLGGNDTLNGGYGFDRLLGGLGDDTYVIGEDDDADEIVELAGEGIDLVKYAWDYTLGDNVEKLTLTGNQSVGGVGNALDNTLTGNSAANELVGLEGNDILDGKSGSDTMIGGLGDDTYFVERAGDVIVEIAGEGVDSVSSSISYTLQDGLEKLTLTGSSTLSATGNAADNVLTGNSGANTITGLAGNDTLDGKGGADTLIGGLGDDIYVVDNATDSVQEVAGEGIDSVQSSIAHTLANYVENLTITGTGTLAGTGNTLDNVLVGGSGANALSGLAGNDTLEGKLGTDTLTGGAGNDTYVMARTYGTDTVVENDATAGVIDVAKFLAGVAYDQLWFKRPSSSNNLEISIIGTTDKLVIKDWYLGTQYRVEEIRTVDGNKVLQAANVQALVTAMAGMTQPPQGQTTLTPAQQATLAPVFASTWQNQTLLSHGSASITTGGNQQSVATDQGGIALPPEGSQASAPSAITPRVPLHGGSNIAAPPPAVVGNGQTGQPALLAEAYALDLQERQRERYLAKYGVSGADSGVEIESLIAAMASFAPGMSMSEALPAENAANRHAMSMASPL